MNKRVCVHLLYMSKQLKWHLLEWFRINSSSVLYDSMLSSSVPALLFFKGFFTICWNLIQFFVNFIFRDEDV